MNDFTVGDTVQVQDGDVMKGMVGTVVYWDDAEWKWLVRVGAVQQNWVSPEHLKLFP